MRPFPRRRPAGQPRWRLLVAILACVVVSIPASGGVAHARKKDHDLKHRKHKVHARVHRAKQQVDQSSHALSRANARLDRARSSLRAAQHKLAGTRAQLHRAAQADARMQARLDEAKQALADARDAVAQAKAEVADQKQQIGQLALRNYQYGDPSMLGLVAVLRAGTPQQVTTQLNAVHNLMARESDTLQRLNVVEDQLRSKQAKVAQAKQEVAAKKAATAATLDRKQALESQAEQQRSEVAGLVRDRRAASAHARRVRAHDRSTLRRLQRKEHKIEQRILARARRARNRRVAHSSSMFSRPVPGYITSPYGWREHPIYHYWGLHDGDDFHAPCGTPERAVGRGRVISEYYSDVWGHRLFLGLGKINGHNYVGIYNHISRYRVGTGARVGRGDVLAYAGTTGWSTGCHLHFTLMRDGNPVNPMNYM